MDIAYLHLMVNHFPIVLSVLGTAAAVLALILRRRGVWLYAAASLTLGGLSGYPVMLTGHGAEHAMDHRWYVVKEALDEHEDAADVATWVLLGTAVVNAFAWWLIVRGGRKDMGGVHTLPSGIVQGLVLITGLASVGTVAVAAYRGGQIVHGSPLLATPPAVPAPGSGAPQIPSNRPAGDSARDTAHVATPPTSAAPASPGAPSPVGAPPPASGQPGPHAAGQK